jgi:hypothetical protein
MSQAMFVQTFLGVTASIANSFQEVLLTAQNSYMAPALIKIAIEELQPARDRVVSKEAGEGSKQIVEGYKSGVILPGGMSGNVSSQKNG